MPKLLDENLSADAGMASHEVIRISQQQQQQQQLLLQRLLDDIRRYGLTRTGLGRGVDRDT